VDGAAELFEVAGDQVGAELDLGVAEQGVDEGLLAGGLGLRALRHPDDALQAALTGVLDGQLVLEDDDGLLAGTIGDGAVAGADQVNGELGSGEQGVDGRDVVGFDVGERVIREDGVALDAEVGFQGFAGLAAVVAGFGEVDDGLGIGFHRGRGGGGGLQTGSLDGRGGRGGLDLLDELGDVPGELGELEVVLLGEIAAVRGVELQGGLFVVEDVEGIAEGVLHDLGEALLAIDGRFDDLEDAGFVVDDEAARGCGGLDEFVDLAGTPFGFDVAGGEDGDQEGGFGELLDDLVGEDIVAAELGIAPDFGSASHAHGEEGGEGGVEAGDPALLLVGERLIVEVGVADEEVLLEGHDVR
jgi:hypothetical protein